MTVYVITVLTGANDLPTGIAAFVGGFIIGGYCRHRDEVEDLLE
jgi:hypothetical protein